MRIAPPRILALPASLVPNFLPMASPAKHIINVTIPIIKEDNNAEILS